MLDSIQGYVSRPPSVGATGQASQAASAARSAAQPAELDFAALIGEAVADLAQKVRTAEAVSMAGIKGAVPVQDVVEKVMDAEQTLQTAIAVRDKIVSAYLEISRMSI